MTCWALDQWLSTIQYWHHKPDETDSFGLVWRTADLLGFSTTTISRVYRERSKKYKILSERQLCERKCLVGVRGQRRMSRLVRDDRKATVTRYNQDMQNIISEHTTRWTLKQMCYSSRRPHRVPLLSDKNRTRRIQFTQITKIGQ